MARLHLNGKYLLRKRFDTLEQAISARDIAEQKYFGEYSYKNSMEMIDTVSK